MAELCPIRPIWGRHDPEVLFESLGCFYQEELGVASLRGPIKINNPDI